MPRINVGENSGEVINTLICELKAKIVEARSRRTQKNTVWNLICQNISRLETIFFSCTIWQRYTLTWLTQAVLQYYERERRICHCSFVYSSIKRAALIAVVVQILTTYERQRKWNCTTCNSFIIPVSRPQQLIVRLTENASALTTTENCPVFIIIPVLSWTQSKPSLWT